MSGEILVFYVVYGVINLINSQLARQATEKLEDKRQEFQKWQQLNNQEFQREQFEKQKQLQKELAEDNRQTQLKVALEQRNTARQVVQDQKLFQNWPLRIVPDQILNANHDENLLSLRIIPAPPVIDFDQFGGNNKSFPNIETGLAQGLREFFNQHYSFQSTERPIELIDGGWDSKRYHGGAAIIGLFALLKSEPVLPTEEWLALTYGVGVGGSLLAIGSASGIIAMSKVKGLTFGAFLRYTPFVFIAYSCGYVVALTLANLVFG